MEEKIKIRISPFQLTVLIILFTTGTTILVTPAGMTAETKQDAWLSSIIGMFLCLGYAYFLYKCGIAMGSKTYIQYLEKVYGRIVGKIIGMLYVFFAFIGTSTLLSYFGFFTTTQILTDTPIEILNILLVLLIIFAVRAGLEVIARTGELLITWFFFLLFALVIFLLPELKLEKLTPVFEASFSDHTKAIFNFVSFAGFPLILFLMFYPKSLNQPRQAKWNILIGSFIGTFTVTVITLLCILVLGASITAKQLYPSYVLAKSVSLFEIIERIESIMASVWVISIFFKSTIYFYTCVLGLAQILKVKWYRPLVFPLGVLACIFSTIVYPNIVYMQKWDSTYWPPYALIMGLIIPLITLIIDKVQNHFRSNNQSKGM
ncbi:endospore germination permease [Caldibacillus lycopersici]|uniref:Endospore germination permease n=1 Tax=Perspicuibacillus lycopersici TaxID=1325689 RepID=A0AAE3IU09_9BACI|nr:endospore germination permease [Perspicuibacillus lycopersici]MCU9614392.1 endospore germination permease [Perspicuibacillus lycopersici]